MQVNAITRYTIGAGVRGGVLTKNNEAIIAHTQPLTIKMYPDI